MMPIKDLKKLLSDTKRFFYEVGHGLSPPYLEDPLEEKILFAPYEKTALIEKLYFKEPSLVLPGLPNTCPLVFEEMVQFLLLKNKEILEQLALFSLKKEALFSVHVIDSITSPLAKDGLHFYPKKSLWGSIPIVAESGVLISDIKKKKTFIEAVSSLLLLHSVDTPIQKQALFLDGKKFQLSTFESETLLAKIEAVLPLAKAAPIELYFDEATDKYQIYKSITPHLENKLLEPVKELEFFLKELYDRI
ncbi:MAG: hypothetical protein ACOYK9_05270 [Chlamydiia bacterium]